MFSSICAPESNSLRSISFAPTNWARSYMPGRPWCSVRPPALRNCPAIPVDIEDLIWIENERFRPGWSGYVKA
jgi:hypothetical protein